MHQARIRSLAGAAIVLAVGVTQGRGSSVVPMTLGRIADYSGQVIVGEVNSSRSYWAENPKRIETEIVLNRVEYLKGQIEDSTTTFELVVPGGQIGETGQRICCAPEFKVGEKWAVFLLPRYKTFPVAGLWQGAFRIEKDGDGIERVHDASGRPVVGLDDEGFVRVSPGRVPGAPQPIGAEHISIVPVDPKSAEQPGMELSAFVEMIRPILANSRAIPLRGPAGEREIVRYRAVPMRSANGIEPGREPVESARDSKGDSSAEGRRDARGAVAEDHSRDGQREAIDDADSSIAPKERKR